MSLPEQHSRNGGKEKNKVVVFLLMRKNHVSLPEELEEPFFDAGATDSSNPGDLGRALFNLAFLLEE